MRKFAYIMYLLFVEAPIVLVCPAHYIGLTTIEADAERAQIYELAQQRDDAISKDLLPD